MSGFSLFELFKTDAEGQLSVLNDGLLRLEREPDDATVVEPLMRAAHSIKGAARIVGLDVIVQLAHAMEDCLVAVQRGQEKIVPARIDQLLRGTDLLAQAAALDEATVAPWSESHGAEIAEVAAALRSAPPEQGPASSAAPPAAT
ncbi:MAG: Hpt domain-containing protein, partial [Phycisphaerales bacterium]|nr:Hpt domain-containing protein [Phycisphaerales bacterium]